MLTVSVNRDIIGKGAFNKTNASTWYPETLSRRDIVNINYYAAYAIAPAVYADHTKRTANWLQSELLIIDVDSKDNPDKTYEDILQSDIVQRYAFAVYPSSSFDGRKASAHILIQLDTIVKDNRDYKSIYDYMVSEYMTTLQVDNALGNGVQACFGTGSVYGGTADTPFSKDDYLYFNAHAPSVPVIETLSIIDHTRKRVDESSYSVDVHEFKDSHYEQPLSNRVNLTTEMLSYVLKDYGRQDYHDDWLPLIFATYDSCNGDASVLEYICNHPDIHWHNRYEVQKFRYLWERGAFSHHNYGNDPVTVATLIFRAKQKGWLTSSPVDLTDYTKIYQQSLTEWLQDLPSHQTRLLIKSNTGTGKTWAAIDKLISLGAPRAVFFAPSIKLCADLHSRIQSRLLQNGITDKQAVLYIEDGKTKDKDSLTDAHILVTTLQTFANKVLQNTAFNPASYGFVVVDESDKLISDFVTAGLGDGFKHLKSHVKYRESQRGITALRQLVDKAGTVIFLDGTATKISQIFLERSTDKPVYTYVNYFAYDKPKTYMVHHDGIFKQLVIKACERLAYGVWQHVYIACDTRKSAEDIYELCLMACDIPREETVLITQQTRNTDVVSAYFADINAHAPRYKLVVYSPTMSSGVSIESIRVNAVLQHCTFLNPSDNLQSLNRVRHADTCYVYRRGYRNLYNNLLSHHESIENRRALELRAYGAKDEVRTPQAQLTEDLIMLVAERHHAESRDKLTYYQHLLKQDKRHVIHYDKPSQDHYDTMVKSLMADLKNARSEVKDYAIKNWRKHEPIDDLPTDEYLNTKHIAASAVHTEIKRLFASAADEDYYLNLNVSDEELATMVLDIGYRIYYYHRVVAFKDYVDGAIKDLLNQDKPRTNLNLVYTQAKLLQTIHKIIPAGMTDTTYERFRDRSSDFVYAVAQQQDTYDTLVSNAKQKFDYLSHKYDDDEKLAIALLSNILKVLGLRKRKNKRQNELKIQGTQSLLRLYELRFDRWIPFDLKQGEIDRAMIDAKRKLKDINLLTPMQYRNLQDILQDTNLSLEDTIHAVKPKIMA